MKRPKMVIMAGTSIVLTMSVSTSTAKVRKKESWFRTYSSENSRPPKATAMIRPGWMGGREMRV